MALERTWVLLFTKSGALVQHTSQVKEILMHISGAVSLETVFLFFLFRTYCTNPAPRQPWTPVSTSWLSGTIAPFLHHVPEVTNRSLWQLLAFFSFLIVFIFWTIFKSWNCFGCMFVFGRRVVSSWLTVEGFSTTEWLVSVVHHSNLDSCSFIFEKQDVPVKA